MVLECWVPHLAKGAYHWNPAIGSNTKIRCTILRLADRWHRECRQVDLPSPPSRGAVSLLPARLRLVCAHQCLAGSPGNIHRVSRTRKLPPKRSRRFCARTSFRIAECLPPLISRSALETGRTLPGDKSS